MTRCECRLSDKDGIEDVRTHKNGSSQRLENQQSAKETFHEDSQCNKHLREAKDLKSIL